MNFIRLMIIILFISNGLLANSFGYLKEVDTSFCMDDCSQYMLESENGDFITFLANTNNMDLSYFINRYIEIQDGGDYQCIECSAIIIQDIFISDLCEYPVECFIDPCEIAEECQLNTPVDCVVNYCGGCYADFYNQNEDIIDCYGSEPCFDLSAIDFGMCNMYMGVGYTYGQCQGISGCGWEVDGVDYSDAFFDSYEDCELECNDDDLLCYEIENEYNLLHSDEYAACIQDSDCVSIWGDCGVGLGECHYSINDTFDYDESNNLVQDWIEEDCMESVCDCLPLPNSICIQGECSLTYCDTPDPSGCFSNGCNPGYECIDFGNSGYADFCVASSCSCDADFIYDSYWMCTEDCNGGTCIPQDSQTGDLCILDESAIGINIPGFIDCDGECVDYEYYSWVGDGWCDEGAWGISLVCEALDCDGGDCPGSWCGCLAGDTNEDQIINILDIVLIVGCIFDGDSLCLCSDINHDDTVDIIDIVIIINSIINP